MRACIEDTVKNLIRGKAPCLWLDTYEESCCIDDMREVLCNEFAIPSMSIWSSTEGLKRVETASGAVVSPPDQKMADPVGLLKNIRMIADDEKLAGAQEIFILRDLHAFTGNNNVLRALRDFAEYCTSCTVTIIVMSPIVSIPTEWEKLFTVVPYDFPSKEEIAVLVDDVIDYVENQVNPSKSVEEERYAIPNDVERQALINACIGLTDNEIRQVFSMSLIKYRSLSPQAAMEQKVQLVKKSGVLDYAIPSISIEDIGGNYAFKEWLNDVVLTFDEEAAAFGVTPSKGFTAVGIPGTGKSVFAEAVAGLMQAPFLKLDMGRIMDRYVGSSEQKINQAIRIAVACAPCVLLIDEVEKSLSGLGSSNSSDSGTMARVFSRILDFLAKPDTKVFTIMTANDISQMNPELTRPGRSDVTWYFSLPSVDEREEIFRIHFKKNGWDMDEGLLRAVSVLADGYTGAEIAEIVKVSIRKAYRRYQKDGNREVTLEDIAPSVKEVIPLSVSSKEKINLLDKYCDMRARHSNGPSAAEKRPATINNRIMGGIRL